VLWFGVLLTVAWLAIAVGMRSPGRPGDAAGVPDPGGAPAAGETGNAHPSKA
jgi:hypothetical protein